MAFYIVALCFWGDWDSDVWRWNGLIFYFGFLFMGGKCYAICDLYSALFLGVCNFSCFLMIPDASL